MAALSTQEVTRDGLSPSYASAAGGGDTFTNRSREVLHVKNGGGVELNVTIPVTQTVDGLAVEDRVVTVPAGEERLIGPFPSDQYGETISLSYDQVSSVTVAVLYYP